MEQNANDQLSGLELEFDNDVRHQFAEAAKWSKFMSIVMFVFAGLALIAVLVGGTFLYSLFGSLGSRFGTLIDMSASLIFGIFIFVILLVVATYYFLYNFSAKVKAALLSENIEAMNAGIASLKIFFIITSVFGILSLLSTIRSLF